MVVVAQLIRASDCGSEGRQFESGQPPHKHDAYESVKKPQLVVARGEERLLAVRAIGVNIMEIK